jgi:predicted anti-sigma-YlaC factor YlaD
VSCTSVRQWFSDYLDGQALPAWPRLFVSLHLTVCPRCRRMRRSLQATGEALAALKDQPPRMGE